MLEKIRIWGNFLLSRKWKLFCVNKDAPGVHKKKSTIFQEYRMECALKSVDAGSSLRAASRKFDLPYSTLRRRFCNQANKIGRPPIFSEYQQRSLMKALSYQCLTFKKVRRRAYIFGKKFKCQVTSHWEHPPNCWSRMDDWFSKEVFASQLIYCQRKVLPKKRFCLRQMHGK